jgi:hypothetical protein
MQNVIIPNRKNLNIELQFSIMHSDNGNEFLSSYKSVCKQFNLKQTFTVKATPEQNAVVERYWRSLMGPTLALMFSSKLDKRLWTYCAAFVNNVILNKLRIITYKGKVTTTHDVIANAKPDITGVRTWGCEAFALDTRKYDPRHFTEKSFKGNFVGYDESSQSALVFDVKNDEVIMTNHLKYNEIVQGIRDVNNITVVNLNFQSIKANTDKDKYYSEPFEYWHDSDDDFDDFSSYKIENGTVIGKNNNEMPNQKLSKRTRDKYEDNKVLSVKDQEDILNKTLLSLEYEQDYKDPNDQVVDFNLGNDFYKSLYMTSEALLNKSFKAEDYYRRSFIWS